MIFSKKKSVVIADLYCDEAPPRIEADVVRYNYWTTPTPGFRCSPFRTIAIDLTQDEAGLLAAMKKNTQYEVRRAAKEAMVGEPVDPSGAEAALPEFCDFHDEAAALKDLPPLDRNWLGAMARAGHLELTRVDQGDAALARHAYYCDGRTAILLYTMSVHRGSTDATFRGLVGRANRYLHWQDILLFKKKGVAIMDMGGWYSGSDDQGMLQINKFKEDFGGKVIDSHNSMAGITLKGKLAVRYIEEKVKRNNAGKS